MILYVIPFDVNEMANATPTRRRACYQGRPLDLFAVFVVSSMPAVGNRTHTGLPPKGFKSSACAVTIAR